MKSTLKLLALAALLAVSPASAADLGGDCCADLEARVADLEASAVKKGNRKVSLSLSGHVNHAILVLDDEAEVVTNDNSQTRFRLKGKGKASPDLTVGFTLEVGVNANASAGDPDGLEVRHSSVYVSGSFGRLTVGRTGTATDGITEIDLSGTSVAGYTNGAAYLPGGAGYYSADGGRADAVRYDTPEMNGFIASASFVDEDSVAVALRYAKVYDAFRVAAGVGFSETDDVKALGASLSVIHMPTGIFGTAAYNDGEDGDKSFYLKAGAKVKLIDLGKTAFFAEYGDSNDAVEFWGLGAVQKVRGAATELYLNYRSYEASDGDDADALLAGARIKF